MLKILAASPTAAVAEATCGARRLHARADQRAAQEGAHCRERRADRAPSATRRRDVRPRSGARIECRSSAALAAIREALHAAEHRTILIHGVTGSGKTEVYIQAIQEVVRFGRQAILLVPEISLTPQTVARFRARFDRVAVLHSHLSDVERHEHWRRIARGEVEVVVGARSAIFAPTPHLG